MEELAERARRFVVGHAYLLYFRRPAPRYGASSLPPADAVRLRSSIEVMRRSGLVPQAELVTVESTVDSFDDQPADVRAVLFRLLSEVEEIAASPKLLDAVGRYRREHFPGVLEEPPKR